MMHLFQNTMAVVTFIIPTIGRETLENTVSSLVQQTSADWRAIIVFDDVPVREFVDERLQCVRIAKTGTHRRAGDVRNAAFGHVNTKWTAFVDDDDVITADYVERLQEHARASDTDVIVFRMYDQRFDGKRHGQAILPPPGTTTLVRDRVGISFCVRTSWINGEKGNFRFRPSDSEDFDLLSRLRAAKARILISPHVAYIVRPPTEPPNEHGTEISGQK
jgi:glycosyltransferase involved in cell wall biosynthesis